MIEGHNVIIQVAWKPIQNKAPDLWKFLDAFNFRYTEYISLLEHYNKVGIFQLVKVIKTPLQESEQYADGEPFGEKHKHGRDCLLLASTQSQHCWFC